MLHRTPVARALALALVFGAAPSGCGDDTDGDDNGSGDSTSAGTGGFVSLIDHQVWAPLEAGGDPLAAHRPETVECTIAGWYVEETLGTQKLEIDTNYCNYLVLTQPTLAPIELGAAIELDFYHFDLTAPEPAEAHIAVLVDGQLLWETVIPIGEGEGTARIYTEEFESPLAAPAGAELVLHLHNHGQNTWTFEDVRVYVASP